MPLEALQVREAANAVGHSRIAAFTRKVKVVRHAAEVCRSAFSSRASEIRTEAEAAVELGAPPLLRRLTGISNLEVPMNRVLGATLHPRSGTAGRWALRAVAGLLEFQQLIDDLDDGADYEVLVEESPEEVASNREPDLMIRSPGAALLLENKVHSPESGAGQYADYVEILVEWAEGRSTQIHLLAPAVRSEPEGWNRSLSYRQLAQALAPLVKHPSLTSWERTTLAL